MFQIICVYIIKMYKIYFAVLYRLSVVILKHHVDVNIAIVGGNV